MIKLNIEQQTDELKDIEDYIKNLHTLSLVELQAGQIRRLLYFARRGVTSYKNYRARFNPAMREEIEPVINPNGEDNV